MVIELSSKTRAKAITAAKTTKKKKATFSAAAAAALRSPDAIRDGSCFLTATELCTDVMFFFTDGSCFSNANVAQNCCPAGWGVLPVRLRAAAAAAGLGTTISLPSEHERLCALLTSDHCDALPGLYGPVVLSSEQSPLLSSFALGAQHGSNNTAELSAIAEALLHFRDELFPRSPELRYCVILYDSEYATKSVTGEFNGKKNVELIARIRDIYSDTQNKLRAMHGDHRSSGVLFVKVKAHSGHEFNDIADELAKRGATESMPARVGRYAKGSTCEAMEACVSV